jgi:pimeloyl-ACP methyl ester carboxylesterase
VGGAEHRSIGGAKIPSKTFRFLVLALLMAIAPPSLSIARNRGDDTFPYKQGFITTNGVRLQYLDWGGSGPALIFVHGLGDNPHAFDDLAPAFGNRFHVIAYARRGHGESDSKAPYDTVTLTEDLRGLMDALGIAKADLVGWSMGGNEITAMAAEYPERVGRLIYLDSYDTADPGFQLAFKAIPTSLLDTPASAMTSWHAYVAYEKAVEFAGLEDMRRIDAYLRGNIVVLPDGTLRPKMSPEVAQALLSSLGSNPLRSYARVHSRALAIYAESVFDPHIADPERRHDDLTWERRYWIPFQKQSIDRARRELANLKIVRVPGAHVSFFLTSRGKVVRVMNQFLAQSKS